MPHKTTNHSNQRHSLNAKRARQCLVGAVARDDSDDELGLDDLPWEWIYEERQKPNDPKAIDTRENVEEKLNGVDTPSKRPKRVVEHDGATREKSIIGARMGSFECRVGDCVLLKAEGTNEAWVGLICDFMDDEEEGKVAHFMWFSTEKEIRNKPKKRTDFMTNEVYITPSWDYNSLASINGKATITSAETYLAKYPSGKIPRNSKHFGKTFICRRGCNTRTATYTSEFIWEDIFHCRADEIEGLVHLVQSETKATRKRYTLKRQRDETDEFSEGEGEDGAITTPKKKRKPSSTTSTPRKIKTPSKLLTPSHKRIVVKKALEFTPLGTRILSPGHVDSSPFQAARSRLHVSAVPASLPCREAEFSNVYSHLESAISDGSGACIYISGTPGTGKTATVREVVAQLNASVMAEELDDFIFVEINGMKVTDPHQSYSLLWEALKGDRVSPSQALDLLEREFNHPSPRRTPCVVLMDELDQLVTRNQSVMYNFFNWPGLRHSRLIVLAVANTMDLPERTLSNKISSRLGLTRITFPGYNHDQLMKIIHSRLSGVPNSLVDPDAIQFAARKVAAVSGDARRALDICRRAVELAETDSQSEIPHQKAHSIVVSTPSKDCAPKKPAQASSQGRVTIATIKRAINEATASPLQQHLRSLPLSSKLLLAGLIAKTRRTGLGESIMGEVIEEARRIALMAAGGASGLGILLSASDGMMAGKRGSVAMEKVTAMGKSTRVGGLGEAAVELMEAGIIVVETRRGDRMGKIRLCVGEEDVKAAFRDDVDGRELGL